MSFVTLSGPVEQLLLRTQYDMQVVMQGLNGNKMLATLIPFVFCYINREGLAKLANTCAGPSSGYASITPRCS